LRKATKRRVDTSGFAREDIDKKERMIERERGRGTKKIQVRTEFAPSQRGVEKYPNKQR